MKKHWILVAMLALSIGLGGCKEDTGETTAKDLKDNLGEMKSDESQKIKPGEVKNDAVMMGSGGK